MGRRSTKENKNIYQLSREEADLTREAAAEALGFISADRIEKIENEIFLRFIDIRHEFYIWIFLFN